MILVVCIFWLHVWANYLGLKIGYPIPLLDLFPFQWPRGEYPILPRSGGWGCLRSALIFRKFRKSGSKKIRFASETYGNWWYLITTVNFAPFASHSTAPLLHCSTAPLLRRALHCICLVRRMWSFLVATPKRSSPPRAHYDSRELWKLAIEWTSYSHPSWFV